MSEALTSIAVAVAGLVLPALLALRHGSVRAFCLLLVIEIALVAVFVEVFWGPAAMAHLGLWCLAVLLFLPARLANAIERMLGGSVERQRGDRTA